MLKRDSGCCAVDHWLHNSLNLVFRQRKLHNIFIFGMAYCSSIFCIFFWKREPYNVNHLNSERLEWRDHACNRMAALPGGSWEWPEYHSYQSGSYRIQTRSDKLADILWLWGHLKSFSGDFLVWLYSLGCVFKYLVKFLIIKAAIFNK